MKTTLRRLATIALSALAVVSCGIEHTTLPQLQQSPPTEASSDLLGALTSLVTMDGLQRSTPLAAPITVSKSIGADGGTIAIPQAGVTVTIPRGALAKATTITMTARAGANVAYEFQPHGLTFKVPVKVQQTIAGTWAAEYPKLLKGMHGSYYDQTSLDSAFIDPNKYFAHVNEHQIGYLESNASQIKFYIGHFSGYLVSCGYSEGR